jgi:hypothetical protein
MVNVVAGLNGKARSRVCWFIAGDAGVLGQEDKGIEVIFSPQQCLIVEYHMLHVFTRRNSHRNHGLSD